MAAHFSRSRWISSGKKMTGKIHDRSKFGRGGAESGRIWKARNFIDEHAGEELSLTRVAKAADTSANYLSEKFKEAVGMNFVQYVALARYEKAATLLREGSLRVSEIAFAAGFQSLSQFNRVFKKFSGKSPTEYRASRARNGNGAAE
jgi:AraC-like DNA-binding protein